MKWLQSLFGRGRPPVPVTTVTVKKEAANVYVIRISGVLNKATMDRLQTVGAQEIERGTKDLRLLLLLDGFQGWAAGGNWGDIDFFATYGNDIARIAVVGDSRWQEKMMTFLFAGRRRGEVRYFMPTQETEARAWLVSP